MRSIGVATRQYKPSFDMTLTDGNGNTYSITDHDVQSDSLAIRTGTSNTGELTLGAAIIGSLSVVLLNDGQNNNKYSNVLWRGSTIDANMMVNGEIVPLGTYYVNDHSEQGGTIRVTAYDAMQILDSYQIYEHNFTWPLDAVTAVNTIATARGLRVSGLDGVNLSLPDPGTDKMSERAFLSYVAQILCKYVVIKRVNGYDTIYFGWYDTDNPVYNAGTTFSHDLKTSDYTPENFQIKVYDKNQTVTVRGTQGQLVNLVTIEGNPFVTSANVGTPNPGGGIAYDMYTKVHALTYRPGTVDIVTDIALEAGDVITVNTGPHGGTYTMIITNLTFGTGLTMSVSSDADPSDDMIFNPSTYFKKATQQAISEELADEDSDLSQALGGGSGVVIVHFPAVVMNCSDSSHWSAVEAPNQASGGNLGVSSRLYIQANNAVRTNLDSNGYDFNRIRWDSCDTMIPAYDANNNRYFDITLYLYSYSMSSGVFPGFNAYDSLNDLTYVYPLRTRARYVDANTLIFDQQWVWGPVGGWGNALGAGVLIPLPSKQFDIANSQWIMPTGSASAGETYYAPVIYP